MRTYKKFHTLDRAEGVLDAQLLSSVTSGSFTISSLSELGAQDWNADSGDYAIVTIENEQILCSAMTETGGTVTLTISSRGYADTTAETHTAGVEVYIRIVKSIVEEIQDEVDFQRDALDNAMIETTVPTITDANTHTIAGDQTGVFTVGRVYLFKVSGTWHRAVVRSATYSDPTTTLEITGDSLPSSGTITTAGFELGSGVNALPDFIMVKEPGAAPTENPPAGYVWVYTVNGEIRTKDSSGAIHANTTPSGTVSPFAGSSAPSGWLLCDGSAVSRTTYADLFSVIDETYGVGDGSTTFNVPDLKGRVPVGYDSGQTEFDALGETGGEKEHTLTEAEMPSHTHDLGISKGGTGSTYGVGNTFGVGTSTSGSTGGDTAHENMPPYITMNYIIKV